MEKDMPRAIMNPVRQRIAQYLILYGQGTADDIGGALPDVPKPSLYRHIRILHEAGLLRVVSERPVRGATEKTYALTEPPPENMQMAVQGLALSIGASFAAYFSRSDADPVRDMLCFRVCTLLLSDAEFGEMLAKIGSVYDEYLQNTPREDRRPRSLVLISAPGMPKDEENT